MTLFPLRPTLTPGDLVATFDGPHSRSSALAWLDRAPRRVRLNLDILTISTIPLDNGRTLTTLRVGTGL